MVMVCNATFNTISVVSWRTVLLVKGTLEYIENTTNLSQVTEQIYQIMLH